MTARFAASENISIFSICIGGLLPYPDVSLVLPVAAHIPLSLVLCRSWPKTGKINIDIRMSKNWPEGLTIIAQRDGCSLSNLSLRL
jgi:hypothetical protein